MMLKTLFQIFVAGLVIMSLSMNAAAQQRQFPGQQHPVTGTPDQRHAPEPSDTANNAQFQPYDRTCQVFQYGFLSGDRATQIYISCHEADSSGHQFFMKNYRDDNPWDIALMQTTFDLINQAVERNAILNLSVTSDPSGGSNPTFSGITIELPR